MPTKYITNTHTLTVTTTKTTVVRSQGVTSTLTLTETSTRVDTVTEQITHTYNNVQPTAVSTPDTDISTIITVTPTTIRRPSTFILDDSDMTVLDEFIVNADGTNDIAVLPAANSPLLTPTMPVAAVHTITIVVRPMVATTRTAY